MAKSPSDNSYRRAAKLLRSIGAIHFDASAKLTPARKAAITRQSKAHNNYIRNPELYVTRTVGKSTADALANQGIEIYHKKGTGRGKRLALIKRSNKDTKVEIRKGAIYTFDFRNGIAMRTLRIDGDFMETLSKARPRKGESFSAQFGNHRQWSRAFSKQELQRYIVNTLQPRFRTDESFDQYITGLTLVSVMGTGTVFAPDRLSKEDARKWKELRDQIDSYNYGDEDGDEEE